MIKNLIGKELLFFDGGMGTMLQAIGLSSGEIPEIWNFEFPDRIKAIHTAYLEAGANIVETNSFGANSIKFHHPVHSSYDTMKKSSEIAKEAVLEFKSKYNKDKVFVAASIGPCGALLEPLGNVSFDKAYDSFKELALGAKDGGADILLIETMADSYELKSAILACKENTNLPIIASFILDESGKLLTGGNIKSVIPLLEGLGVDAVGINCGFGPEQMLSFMEDLRSESSLPIMVNSNAGMPVLDDDGNTVWSLSPKSFAEIAVKFIDYGVSMVGGCCGTTPKHIKELINLAQNKVLVDLPEKLHTVVSSYADSVKINEEFKIIGEKINPTGNKPLKEAIQGNNFDYVSSLALSQIADGAHIIDVNAGMPSFDEEKLLLQFVSSVQKVCSAPLMIDSSNTKALEKACRYYNGKPFINSVSGKEKSLNEVLPIAKKYGGVLIALTLDDDGIPNTPQGRVDIALKIIDRAKSYGISQKDIVVDPLTLTISSNPEAANTTIQTIKILNEHGIKTSIGLSNVSFGLPHREIINSTFFAQCLLAGLNTAIVNPSSQSLMNVYYAHRALCMQDENCATYIEKMGSIENSKTSSNNDNSFSLKDYIIKGLKEDATKECETLIKTFAPLEIVSQFIVPALDKVGETYEKGISFLPQLLMSAEAAQGAFSVLQKELKKDETNKDSLKEKVLVATVHGDIHDIGKNIAKVLLENYGYQVIDLGKDVPPTDILETILKEDVKLVGLSALMTTTLPSMEETIRLIRENNIDCKVMVGGAVLTKGYAQKIGADFYCKDAMSTVKYAEARNSK